MVDRFGQFASQDPHDAMGIGMVVDGRAFAWIPYQQQLRQVSHFFKTLLQSGERRTYNVCLAVDVFDGIAGIVLTRIVVEEPQPIIRI